LIAGKRLGLQGGQEMKKIVFAGLGSFLIVAVLGLSSASAQPMYVMHTGITVSNLERSVKFYRDVVGLNLKVPPTDVFSGKELSKGVGVPGASLKLAVFALSEGSEELEMLQYLTPKSPNKKALPPNALGSCHVAIRVKDIAAKVKDMEAKGVKFLTPPNSINEGPLAGWKWCYFKDPDGISMELVECGPPYCQK
jgi:catechol 2,3-dioxygenase-like lactoylglutathione lyase family enzyme